MGFSSVVYMYLRLAASSVLVLMRLPELHMRLMGTANPSADG